MTSEIALTLAIVGAAIALFAWNRLAVEVVGLMVMAALVVAGLVTPQQGLAGFSNEATVTVALMLVLSAGLVRTGAVDALGRRAATIAGKGELQLLAVLLASSAAMSALLNNTAVVAILLPLVLGLSRAARVAPSRLLMPLSFASQLGGTLTLVGTSTNLLVAGVVLDAGLGRIGFFQMTPPALVLTALGLLYLLTLGRLMMPAHSVPTELAADYDLRQYFTSLRVAEDSPLVGRSLAESRFGDRHGFQIVEIRRTDGHRIVPPSGATVVHAGDVLVATGSVPDIARIEETEHLSIEGTPSADPAVAGSSQASLHLAELLVPRGSAWQGRDVTELDLRRRFGVTALAVQRHGEAVHAPVGRIALTAGDLLLVQGRPGALRALHESGDLVLLGRVRLPARRRRKLPPAVTIMAAVVALPVLDVTTIFVSSLLGVLAMLLVGCITPAEAYEDLDWPVVILLATLLPLGTAMRESGTADWLAQGILGAVLPLGAYGALAAVYLLTVALTSVISNNAAALVLVPVAIAAANELGLSPLPFVIAVMFAASSSFITPIGYQTNTFIYGPGGYRFGDFLRVGAPLNLLLAVASTIVIPWFFPFRP